MWYSILARSVRNDFLFPELVVNCRNSNSARRSSPRNTASVFLCDGIRHNQLNTSFNLHYKNKEIFTGYIPVGVSFFVAKKSGKETDMKSVRDPPE